MEKCKYCGLEYHPMLRATKPGELIYVCEYHFIFDENGNFVSMDKTDECKDKALTDGYKLRRDLTPNR